MQLRSLRVATGRGIHCNRLQDRHRPGRRIGFDRHPGRRIAQPGHRHHLLLQDRSELVHAVDRKLVDSALKGDVRHSPCALAGPGKLGLRMAGDLDLEDPQGGRADDARSVAGDGNSRAAAGADGKSRGPAGAHKAKRRVLPIGEPRHIGVVHHELAAGVLFQFEPPVDAGGIQRVVLQQSDEVMLEYPHVVGFLKVRSESRHAVVERGAGAIERAFHVPWKEHKASICDAAIEIAVLAAILREEIPRVDVASDCDRLHQSHGIDQPFDIRLCVGTHIDFLEEADQGAVVVLVLPGPLHPFAVIPAGVVGALVAPVGVAARPLPIVPEPPFVVDLVQLAFAAVLETTVEHVVADHLHLFPNGTASIVDLDEDELVLGRDIPEQIQPVADNPVVGPVAHVVVAIEEFPFVAEAIVIGEFELGPADVPAAGKGAAGGANLAAVDDVLLIDDHGRIEVMVGMNGKRIAVGVRWTVPALDRPQIECGQDEPHPPQVARARGRIEHEQGRPVAPGSGRFAHLAVFQECLDVELHDLPTLAVLGQFRGVDPVAGLLVAVGETIVVHGLAGPVAAASVVVRSMPQQHQGRGER